MKKKYLKEICCFVLIITFLLASSMTSIQASGKKKEQKSNKHPKYVFYFIGDGMGVSQRQITEYYKQHTENDNTAKLLMNDLPVAGLVTTHAVNTLVTDSAAAGTALATGYKTNSSYISVAPDGETEYKTILEAAEEKGLATGLITNTTVTHATPASFAAHIDDRDLEDEIAEQYVDQDIEFIAGGGLGYFLPQNMQNSKRDDDRNLVQEFEEKGYIIIESKEELENTVMSEVYKSLALFSNGALPFEIDRINNEDINTPELAQMTQAGIEVLSRDEDGFFMMVEGGQIDSACHQNDLPSTIHETLAFDKAIQVAYDFYLEHPKETLIVVVADHETGGLGLGTDYSLNLAPIDSAIGSVIDVLLPIFISNPQDIQGLLSAAEELYGIILTEEEKEEFMNDFATYLEIGQSDYTYFYNGFGPMFSKFISNRTNIAWTSTSHTAAPVPITVVGKKSELFSGYKDNTEIAKLIAEIMHLNLN